MFPIPDKQHNHEWATALVKTKPKTYGHLDELQTFSPPYGYGLDGQVVDDMLKALFTVTNKNRSTMRQALQCALLSLAQCSVNTTSRVMYGFVHRRTTKRTKPEERYKDRAFNDEQMTRVLDGLKDCGYVSFEAGFKGESAPKGLATLWFPGPLFADWLEEHVESLQVVRFVADDETVILNSDDAGAKRQDYMDDDQTNAMRERIVSGNALRISHQWTYAPLDRDIWDDGEVRRGKLKKTYRQFKLDDERVQISPESLVCRRVFKGSFQAGGRFYCGAQNLSKAERATIWIDGESTIELDIKSQHPRLLYHLEGVNAPADCYAADTEEQRAKNKMICLYLINNKDRGTARKAFMADFGGTAAEADAELQQFIDQHPKIAHHFFKSGWRRLQYLDSQLTDAVLAEGVAEGIAMLPVHDSFIVAAKKAPWLKETILRCYRALTGFDTVIDW